METILLDLQNIDIYNTIRRIEIPSSIQFNHQLLIKMIINSKENIRPLDVIRHKRNEIPLRRRLSFGEEMPKEYKASNKTVINRSSIVSIQKDNLASFEPFGDEPGVPQPALYKGEKVYLLYDNFFFWWYLKSDTQFFPLDFIPLTSLSQVILKLPRLHYFASDNNEFSPKDYVLTLITIDKTRHNFISTELSSVHNIYSFLQGRLGTEHVRVESCFLLKTTGPNPIIVLNDHLLLNNPPLSLYNFIKRSCPNLKTELTSSYLELRFDFKFQNPITELAFKCSFMHRGICSGKCTIFPEHLLFEGFRNRIIPLIGIFPLRDIASVTAQKRFFLGSGIKVSLGYESFFFYSINPSEVSEQLLSLKNKSTTSLS